MDFEIVLASFQEKVNKNIRVKLKVLQMKPVISLLLIETDHKKNGREYLTKIKHEVFKISVMEGDQ